MHASFSVSFNPKCTGCTSSIRRTCSPLRQRGTFYLPWEVPAPHGLQAPFGPIIIKTRSSGGAHWPGKAFKMPVKQDRLTALKVNRLLQISQLLMEKNKDITHTELCLCGIFRRQVKCLMESLPLRLQAGLLH